MKILLIDIETSPLLGYSWGMFDTNILSVLQPVKVISCAWKWLDDKVVQVKNLSDYDEYEGGTVNDQRLVTEIWHLLDEADIVIAHNGASFDIKILNTRFIANGLTAPSDYEIIDTLKVSRKYFKFSSNKLDELGAYLQEGRKASAGGFSTWLKCMDGNVKAWEKMSYYNAMDILLLERIYLRLRPFMKTHPEVFAHKECCTVCGSPNVQRRGERLTKVGKYKRFQCKACASWFSGPYEKRIKSG